MPDKKNWSEYLVNIIFGAIWIPLLFKGLDLLLQDFEFWYFVFIYFIIFFLIIFFLFIDIYYYLKKEINNKTELGLDTILVVLGVIISIFTFDPLQFGYLIGFILINIVFSIAFFSNFIFISYFRLPQFTRFIPYDLYFKKIEPHLLALSFGTIPKFKMYIKTVENFLRSPIQNIFLIHSPGGYGKSHFLREIAQNTHKSDPKRQVWMITKIGNLIDVLQEEIVAGKKYLLIMDDADRSLEEIKPLLSFSQYNISDIKVILASRTSGVNLIQNIINELRLEEYYQKIFISKWEKADLIHLLRKVVEKDKVKDEEIIALKFPNPFLIVWIGKKIKQEPTYKIDDLKEKFVHEIEYEGKRCLKDVLESQKVKEFLLNLVCVIPFTLRSNHVENNRVIGKLSYLFDLTSENVEEAITNLKESGILRLVGFSIRFNPDMKGDLFLAYRLEQINNQSTLKRLIKNWIRVIPETFFINLEAVSIYAEVPMLSQILSEMVNSWIDDAERTSGDLRIERLKSIEKICMIIPTNSLNLLNSYLTSIAPPSDDPIRQTWGIANLTPTTDNYGPVISKLTRIASLRSDVISIIEMLQEKNIAGQYYNYKADYLIKEAITPIYNSPEPINTTLDIILNWIENFDDSKIKLAIAALSELLAGSHEDLKNIFWQRHPVILKDIPEIHELRNKAIQIIMKMIHHSILKVQLAGLTVVHKIGGNRIDESTIPLQNKISTERKEVIQEIGKLISSSTLDHLVLIEIENLFLEWWAHETPGTEKVSEFLYKIPKNPEYIILKYFIAPEWVIEDFKSIEEDAPSEGKWKWFVHNVTNSMRRIEKIDFSRLISAFNEKYKTASQITQFLIELDEKISITGHAVHQPIIATWIKLNSDAFLKIRKDSKLWTKIPSRFKNDIELSIDQNEESIKKLYEEIISDLPNTCSKIHLLLRLLEKASIKKIKINEWISELIKKGNSECRAITIYNMFFLFKRLEDSDSFMNLLRLAIQNEEKLSQKFVENLSIIVINIIRDKRIIENNKLVDNLQKDLFNKLKILPNLHTNREFGFHIQNLLDFILIDLNSIIKFLDYRFQRWKETLDSDDERFDIIPFDGIRSIAKFIISYEDFSKFIHHFMIWYKKDPFFEFPCRMLIKPLIQHLNPLSTRPFIEEYIEHELESERIENILFLLECLPLSESNIPLFIKAAKIGLKLNKITEIKKLLHRKAFPTDTSTIVGQTPPALLNIRKIFQKMNLEINPGRLKMIIQECIDLVDRNIEDEKKRHEELLNPRR